MTAIVDRNPTDTGGGRLAPLLERLSRQSVSKGHNVYADIAWDEADMAISAADPRVGLFAFDPLASTDWYRAQDAAVQQAVGLHRIAAAMKVGMQFENLLQRGLLSYAMRMDNGDPEFRYCQHEVIEEAQHSMMFQELVNRTGLPVEGMPVGIRTLATIAVPIINRLAPELFFVLVLGGEDPIDYLQRRQLREGTTHPLIERVMRIHVNEEARHIAYARTVLKERVPALSRTRRYLLSLSVPFVLSIMVPLMVDAPGQLAKHHGVPSEVLREARLTPEARLLRKESVAKLRRLCRELGLMNRSAVRTWRRVGLYQRDLDQVAEAA
ncbi:MAG: diiron oxygenase [Acidimicrobiales bacterium]|nr:diiron oxygenase [Acidimicrobiales bacterium]